MQYTLFTSWVSPNCLTQPIVLGPSTPQSAQPTGRAGLKFWARCEIPDKDVTGSIMSKIGWLEHILSRCPN